MVKDTSLNQRVRREASYALGNIAEAGQAVSPEAQKALLHVVKETSFDEGIRWSAVNALGKIAVTGQAGVREAQEVLLHVVKDTSLDRDARKVAAKALGRIDLSDLGNTVRDDILCSLVLEICYLTQRAFVISEEEISIIDRRRRVAIPIQEINVDLLRSTSARLGDD